MIRRARVALSTVPILLGACATAEPPMREACLVDTGGAAVATANDQHAPAGVLVNDTLHVLLDARAAILIPEDSAGPRLAGAAFAEHGSAPSIPGPLLRAPAGTTIRADVCNTLPDTVWLIGFSDDGDTIPVAPGTSLITTSGARGAGFRGYRGMTRFADDFRPGGPSGQMAGAIVLDGPERWGDRVLVITDWAPDPDGDDNDDNDPFGLLVNGRSWPYTERLHYAVGDTARWIVVNASPVEHPMHLHGFHFAVNARSGAASDSVYSAARVREAVTETLLPGQSMAMTWIPERGGRWLFHCHIASHMSGDQHFMLRGQTAPDELPHGSSDEEHARIAMAGLIVGIEVDGDPAAGLAQGPPARRERLLIQERPAVYGDVPGYGFVLQGEHPPAPDSIVVPGPPLLLRRGEPAEIVVVNHLTVPTSVHWHGLEIESYFDGVPGWTGDAQRRSPLLQPGDSLTVRVAPPRSGTYIYHAHADERRQLGAGLFGPIVVLEPGQAWDPATDHVLLFSVNGTDGDAPVVANHGLQPALALAAGRENRIRLINITADDLVGVTLLAGTDTVQWRVAANDGAELPVALRGPMPARLLFGPGETADVLLTPAAGQDLRVMARSFNDFETVLRVR